MLLAGLTLAWITGCSRPVTPPAPPAPEPTRPADVAPPDSVEPDTPDTAVVDSTSIMPDRAARREIRVCAGGDVTLGGNLDTTWISRASEWLGYPVDPLPDPDSLLAPIRGLVEDADVVLVNVEGAIGEGPVEFPKCRPDAQRCYAFRQPVEAAAALARFASSASLVGNLANNHALDAGGPGLLQTIRHLEEAGAMVTGTDTTPTLIALGGDDTLAVLGFSSSRSGPDPRDLEAVWRHVGRARGRYGRVVVTMHMGAEGEDALRTPDSTEFFLGEDRGNVVAFARTAAEAGASLVIGHGPHVIRAVEWWGTGLIFYSLGNLVTYGPFNVLPPRHAGAIACANLAPDGRVTRAVLRSTRQRYPGFVRPDPDAAAAVLADSLSRLDFPETAARVLPDGSIPTAVSIEVVPESPPNPPRPDI